VMRGRLAPFSDPRAVVEEYVTLAREYGCSKVSGDHYAAEWVVSAFRDCGMKYETLPINKSTAYLESLASFNQGNVSIPNHTLLLRELRGLERRTHRGGWDTADHGAHGFDAHANVLCSCVYVAIHEARKPKVLVGAFDPQGRVAYLPKNNPWMEEERQPVRVLRVDEHGRPLSAAEAAALRHTLPAQRKEAR